MVICTLLGKIKELHPNGDDERTSVVIQTNQPFRKSYKRFLFEDESELGEKFERFQRDSQVQISYESNSLRQTLLSVEAVCINTCSVCQTYWKTDEEDNMSCESCKITSDLVMVTRCLRLVTVEPDGYNGSFLTFIDEKNDVRFTTKVEDDFLLYGCIANFNGDNFYVKGEVVETLENGDVIFDLLDYPQLYNELIM